MTTTETYAARVPAAAEAPLPPLVRRYLDRVLPRGATIPGHVRITQDGRMWLKPDGRALRFRAVEELTVEDVAFTWSAKVRIAPLVSMHVVDSYAGGEGRLEARLFGAPVIRAAEQETALAEAMRYLAELAWVPQALSANRALAWDVVDEQIVEVSTPVGDARALVGLRFDRAGDLMAVFGDRPRCEGRKIVPRHWVGLFRDYAEVGGIRIPTEAEVYWDLPDGPFTYWRGTVTSLQAV